MDVKYLVIDNTDSYHTSVGKYESKEKMLDAVQHKDISEIEVWEVAKRVRLTQRPSIVMDDERA